MTVVIAHAGERRVAFVSGRAGGAVRPRGVQVSLGLDVREGGAAIVLGHLCKPLALCSLAPTTHDHEEHYDATQGGDADDC
jgi:hypothetical protein